MPTGDGGRLAIALAIGLLLGIERERRKGTGPGRAPAGIRTFALVALLGGVAMLAGGGAVVAVGLAFVGAAALVSYVLGDRTDPGLTTEVALTVAFLLGALTQREPALAAGLGVAVAVLLAARQWLHRLVASLLTEQELHDLLLLAAAALVVLPLVPDRSLGPYDAINPFRTWRLVVLVMGAGGTGYVALRALGPRYGLSLAGFASGFVSSAATIAAMGNRARANPALREPAIAGAVLSSVATVIYLTVVLAATSAPVLERMTPALLAAGVIAAGYGGVFTWRALRATPSAAVDHGRPFDLRNAVVLAVTLTLVSLAAAAAADSLGTAGVVLAAALAGFVDTHAAAASVAALVAAGTLPAADAPVAIMASFTTNALTKAALAVVFGGRRFSIAVVVGVMAGVAAAWAATLASTGT